MVLVLVPIGIFALWFFAYGSALTSQNQAQSHSNWLGWVLHQVSIPFVTTLKLSVQLAKTIAHWMFPALKYAERQVAGYFVGISKYGLYHAKQAHRTIIALNNVLAYVTGTWAREEALRARKATEALVSHLSHTKAPSLPQRRITQKDADAEFERLIKANFAKQLKQDFPKFDWDPGQWKKWLGVLPALGGAVVTQPHHAPQPQPAPNPNPSPNPADNPATQPTTLPHTDDNPNPDPGTQVVPGVISGKDRWARGQIQQLKKRENSRWSHLGPLALLALTPLAIKTLIGLLECKNIQRLRKPFCSMPSEFVNWLLGIAVAAMTAIELCNIAQAAATLTEAALPALEELLLVEELICIGGGASYPSAYLPGDFSHKIVPLSVI